MNRATTVSTAPARGKVRTRRLSRPRGTQPRHGSQAPPPAPHLRPHPAPPRGSATKARRRPASTRKYHPPTDDASAGGMAIREGTKSLNTVSASGILERRFDHANTHSTTRPTTRTHRVVSHSARHSHERPEAETRYAATINVPCLLLLSWLREPTSRTGLFGALIGAARRRATRPGPRGVNATQHARPNGPPFGQWRSSGRLVRAVGARQPNHRIRTHPANRKTRAPKYAPSPHTRFVLTCGRRRSARPATGPASRSDHLRLESRDSFSVGSPAIGEPVLLYRRSGIKHDVRKTLGIPERRFFA